VQSQYLLWSDNLGLQNGTEKRYTVALSPTTIVWRSDLKHSCYGMAGRKVTMPNFLEKYCRVCHAWEGDGMVRTKFVKEGLTVYCWSFKAGFFNHGTNSDVKIANNNELVVQGESFNKVIYCGDMLQVFFVKELWLTVCVAGTFGGRGPILQKRQYFRGYIPQIFTEHTTWLH